MRKLDLTAEISEPFLLEKHSGTRIEAPGYIVGAGKTLEQYRLKSLELPAALLELTHKKGAEPIDDEDLEGAEEHAGLAVREGEVVVLYTSCDELGYPYLSENGAEFLEFKHPYMIGTNATSLDRIDSLPAHSILLRAGILVLEGICNLEKIQESRFRLQVVPLKVRAVASAARATAVIDS